jgi:hypothetical protein
LAATWTHQAGFIAAGYEEVQGITTPREKGGLRAVVKQYGRLSFSRVLDSGHAVSSYAPETVYRIFQRSMMGMDVVTGKRNAVGTGYHTTGPRDSWSWRNKLPASVPQTCMVEGQFQKRNPWASILGI